VPYALVATQYSKANAMRLTQLTVTRPRQYADRVRAYKMFLDGQLVGEIRANQTVKVNVPPGVTRFQAKVDWCMSKPFFLDGLSDGDVIETRNSFSHKLWIPFIPIIYSLFKRDEYIALSRVDAASLIGEGRDEVPQKIA
jgi:hypothetical protein